MIVVDASVLANVVADHGESGHQARARLARAGAGAVPDLADVETASVLRTRWLAGDLTDRRLRSAVDDLLALPLTRVPTGRLLRRAVELRAHVSTYDAVYVALAEAIACPFVTADSRLARAHGIRCDVEVLPR